jgi:hypothetical protein
MTEKDLIGYWRMGFGIGALVVAAVAGLLLAIIGVARSILSNAERSLTVANEIVINTQPIWELDRTNAVASQLLDGAQIIEKRATQLADALQAPAGHAS